MVCAEVEVSRMALAKQFSGTSWYHSHYSAQLAGKCSSSRSSGTR